MKKILRILFLSLLAIIIFIAIIVMTADYRHAKASSRRYNSSVLLRQSSEILIKHDTCLADSRSNLDACHFNSIESNIFSQSLGEDKVLIIDFKNDFLVIFIRENEKWRCKVPEEMYQIIGCNPY